MNGREVVIRLLPLLSAILALASPMAVRAQDDSIVTISTFWSQSAGKPGDGINLAVVLDIREPYHINAHTAKEPFIPTRVELTSVPKELVGSTLVFPKPRLIEFGIGDAKEKILVFSRQSVVFIPMVVDDSARPGEALVKIEVGKGQKGVSPAEPERGQSRRTAYSKIAAHQRVGAVGYAAQCLRQR